MVKILYVATKMTSGLSNYEKTLDLFKYEHEKLGYGQIWGGWRFRMKLYMEACLKEPSETILVLTDADDVLCVKSGEGMLEKFLSFNKSIVCTAEVTCNIGVCLPVDNYWKVRNQLNQSSYKYVNCGTMMGRAGALAKMWKWMLDNNFQDDQLGLCNYVNTFPELFHVDSTNSLFYVVPPPVANATPLIEWQKNSNNISYVKSLRETVDQSVCEPFFIHFAGNFVQPAVFSALILHPPKLLYDQMAQTLLKENAMNMFQTNEVGRQVGVAVTWAMVLVLALIVVLLIIVAFIYRRRALGKDHSCHENVQIKKLN